MTDVQQREAARQFYYRWKGKGREDEEARSYWIEILSNILGVDRVTERVDFEKKVKGYDGNTKRIDVYIPETRVLIEQKSIGIALDKPQTGHNGMTPYEQAKMYDDSLPFSEKARWIVTSNFAEIWIYDMNVSNPQPLKLELADLQSKFHLLCFLTNKETKKIVDEMKLSLDAGKLVGKIYDAFLKQYQNPEDPETLKSLNKLCVRIVFCLYGEDAGIFGKKNLFHNYMVQFDAAHARKGLRDLFRVLDQKDEERDRYLANDDPVLASFPYVNGGLFSDEDIEIPPFTEELLHLILRDASDNFDWSDISPTIFGAVFESTLNPETRRSGGMHYTSIENIHKVIDPLFLDDLKAEFEEIKQIKVVKTKERKLRAFQDKLASLKFLDPAAGSGNFLTESYLSIRRLENEVVNELTNGQMFMGYEDFTPIKVNISQFYGIEINDFAVTVARTALWIAENQMMKATEDIIKLPLNFLPLKTNAHIVEGNALRIDWNDVVDKNELNYIMGNPPFVGARLMKQGSIQKKEVQDTFGKIKDVQDLDYVTCWYKIAANYIQNTKIEVCFVSTNSICQGSQVPILWNILLNEFHIHINYAYQTFRWNSESLDQAAVHCVIVCFANYNRKSKYIYPLDSDKQIVKNISPYLTEGTDTFVVASKNALCNVPKMSFGNQPRDGGNFVISPDERTEILSKEPDLEKWLHPYIGAEEFIKGKKRYCLWLVHATPNDIKRSKILYNKVEAVRQFRLSSSAKTTNGYAKVPNCFAQMTQPEGVDYLIVPRVSSENRIYIPIGFMLPDNISSDAVQIVPNATVFHFGVLTSNVHMAWMRAVCGRLEMRYRYSKEIVYNTFPWPEPTESQKRRIEETAQGILDVREKYADTPMSTLYDRTLMPNDLYKAHKANDKAVMQAYGMPIKETDEAACVAWLMRLYQKMTT
ncbi:Type II restriction/modification system, DNA methylase subunit YeeA [Ruminococcaceae bacterium P7]|nr:Type II restriction/modification system, DNA methylase subunit YeeA [Ruminococcaceae bacterium P7]